MNQEELQNAIIALSNRINDLEQQLQYHVGVTNGQNTIFSPHPSTEAELTRYGEVVRVDKSGIQFLFPDEGNQYSIAGVESFVDDPTQVTPVTLLGIGQDSELGGRHFIEMRSFNEDSGVLLWLYNSVNVGGVFSVELYDQAITEVPPSVFALASMGFNTTAFSVDAVPIKVTVSGTPSTLENGMLWYDTSTNEFRIRQNGVTRSIDSTAI